MRDWPALRLASAGPTAPRVPFFIGDVEVGSVARAHLAALRTLALALDIHDDAVRLNLAEDQRDAGLYAINGALREQGLIRAWRDETFAIVDPRSGALLARTERAAARFWGTLTLGAHATGYVADAAGRPTHLWIAQRSTHKATDPGRFDNLVGGGVPCGQTPAQALVREAWEEAGLTPTQLRDVTPGSVLRLSRDIPEGFQHEWLHSFDLCLPEGLVPANQDGEVAGFELLPLDAALAIAAGDTMTVDASLVTLDFALRHTLLSHADHHALSLQTQAIRG